RNEERKSFGDRRQLPPWRSYDFNRRDRPEADGLQKNDQDIQKFITTMEGENELDEIKKQRDEYLAGWQRAKADFANYKKEEMKHLEEVARYGSEDLIKDLISVLDNFDLGLRALEKTGPVEKGVYLIRSQIR